MRLEALTYMTEKFMLAFFFLLLCDPIHNYICGIFKRVYESCLWETKIINKELKDFFHWHEYSVITFVTVILKFILCIKSMGNALK